MVAPGASARRPSRSGLRPSGIFRWTLNVIVGLKPVAAPFVHVFAHFKKAIPVCRRYAHLLRAALPAKLVTGARRWTFFTPWKRCALLPAACSSLPFRLRRQAISLSRRLAQPFAVSDRLKPRNRCGRLLKMIEVRIGPGWWWRSIRVAQEAGVFRICDLTLPHRKFVDPNLMNRAFILLSIVRSHPKPSGGNPDHCWNDVPMGNARSRLTRHDEESSLAQRLKNVGRSDRSRISKKWTTRLPRPRKKKRESAGWQRLSTSSKVIRSGLASRAAFRSLPRCHFSGIAEFRRPPPRLPRHTISRFPR